MEPDRISPTETDLTPEARSAPDSRQGIPGIRREPEAPPLRIALGELRRFGRRHGKRLWWIHSLYALGLGAGVVAFAQKGFEHARWLAISVVLAWLLVVLLFRLFGKGSREVLEAQPRVQLRFYVMTYVLKNLYQGMLFFLVPFYWKSATPSSVNVLFFVLLAICAVLSTLDIVFDEVLMRFRILASIFHGLTLFGCLNLVIPALFPDTRTLHSLVAAGAIAAVAFLTMHVPLRAIRDRRLPFLLLAGALFGGGIVYAIRGAIPPVPMHVSMAAVGPAVLPDGRLAMEVRSLHASVIDQLLAVTDVVVPGGKGDSLRHVWRRDGVEVHRFSEGTTRVAGPFGTVRLRSTLGGKYLPVRLSGHWSVDIETEDGQLVGRTQFDVAE